MDTLLRFGLCSVCMFVLVIGACGQESAKQRPFLTRPPFEEITTSDPEALLRSSQRDFGRGASALAQSYQPGGRQSNANTDFYRILHSAIKVYEGTENQECRQIAVAMLQAATAEFYDMSEKQLRDLMDEEGAFNPGNIAMKSHCYDLALLYHITGDRQAARQAAIILDRYNQVIRQWPLRERYEGDQRYAHDDARFKARWDATCLYGEWKPGFVERGQTLAYAYDLIYDSGVMQQMGVLDSAQAGIRYHIEFAETYPADYGNLDHYDLRGYCRYGILLPEPEYVHHVVKHLGEIIQAGFYADGFWHEGSPAYHKDLINGLSVQLPGLLNGYSDPPGFASKISGTRFDDFSLTDMYYPQFKRMWSALGSLTLPDRSPAAIHDASHDQSAWWMPGVINRSAPRLLGCMGHVIMGKGEDGNQQQAHLHFSGMHGHEHYDTLNILVWSQGQEMMSETRYRPLPDDVSTREWHSMTAAHNTVVIDETNQIGRLSSHRRKLTEDDALPFPDPQHRNFGHGDSLTDGQLRFFSAQWAPVQISEAQGEEAYHGLADLYRRTLAMVEIDEEHVYLVDVFRVRGGSQHDWMLHGCLALPYAVQTDLPLHDVAGTQHKYIERLQSAQLEGVQTLSMVYEDGKQSRHWLMMPEGTDLYVGQAPAMRRTGYNPFAFARHQATSSLFVAVHEFFAEDSGPQVASVEPLQMLAADAMDAGVRVTLTDGRSDLLISRFDPDNSAQLTAVAGAMPMVMRGRAAHVRSAADGTVQRVFGVGLAELQVGDVQISDQLPAYEGIIITTERKLTGDEADALHTTVELPTDGSLDGAPVILRYGDDLVQSFPIERVEALPDGGSRIVLQYDAGVTIEKGGEMVKLHYFPGWGMRGQCHFTIVNTVLGQRDADGQMSLQQHPKTDWPPPIEDEITYWLPK